VSSPKFFKVFGVPVGLDSRNGNLESENQRIKSKDEFYEDEEVSVCL